MDVIEDHKSRADKAEAELAKLRKQVVLEHEELVALQERFMDAKSPKSSKSAAKVCSSPDYKMEEANSVTSLQLQVEGLTLEHDEVKASSH